MAMRHILRSPEGEGGGGGAAPAPAPAAPAPAPAAPAPSPAAPAPAPAAPAPGPAAPAPSGAPAAAPAADGKGYWPEDWRERTSKGDDKRLQKLQRYGSPEAVADALIAAQARISSGELKPVLGKTPTPEELKEWREAHGIPEDPTKYDLGKDVKIEAQDKPFFDVLFKAAHDSNQNAEQVKATVQAFNVVREKVAEHQQQEDQRMEREANDSLRGEWGEQYRRNINLIHGLLDGSGSQGMKENLLRGRLADGTPIGSSPDAMKTLLGLALINNPTGVIVPGGNGVTGEGIRTELEKLQKIPTNRKTAAQSEQERGLISAAIKANLMDERGAWKKA